MPASHTLLIASLWLCVQVFPVLSQQSFASTPVDTDVIEGQDATLQCAVENLQGSIIWSKDDTMLGTDRALPGYTRYTMQGDVSREGNLVIQRAELGDDAEYRCHVTATDATHQNLRSDPAALTVLLPPGPPVIEGYSNGTVIPIQPPATVELVCNANNGKPAPDIKWLKDGEDLAYGSPEVVSTPAGDPSGKRVNAASTLTLNPEKEDNGLSYGCLVSHGALSAALYTYVTLDVLYPPGAPVISGYSAGTIVKTGDHLNLLCSSFEGNPLAEVYWYKNNERMDYSFTTDEDSSDNLLPLQVDYSDNNAIYKCTANSPVLAEPLSTQIQLTVNFAPAFVNITGHENMVQSDVTLTLKCTSANSNPASTISWFTSGRLVKTHEDVIVEAPNGGYITSQELTVTMTADTDSVDYMCQATNQELYETTSDTVTVNVMYPPDKPTITGYEVGTEVKADKLLRLVCFAMGGNPLATLTWYKNGVVQEAEAAAQNVLSTSTLEIILDQTDNGAVYSCNASNEATPVPLHANITLNVLFPPGEVTVSVEPQEAKEGESVLVTCETASSNPESQLTWWRDGVLIQQGPNNITTEVVDGENGGRITRSQLLLPSVTSANNGGVYLCRAMNDLVVESVNDGVTLDIKFKPIITTSTGIALSSHEVPGVLSLNCSANANPSDITFTWNKNDAAIDIDATERYTLDASGSLLIHNVTREEAGTYMCIASNSEGSNNITAALDVMYSAKVTTGEAITITLNTPGELICEADANPKPANYITWSRPGFDLTSYSHEYRDGRGVMRVDNVTKAVSGMYLCHADNGIPPPDTKNIQVIIQCEYLDGRGVMRVDNVTKAVSGMYLCHADNGIPPPDTKNIQVIIQCEYLDGCGVMRVDNVTKAVSGMYLCHADNGIPPPDTKNIQVIIQCEYLDGRGVMRVDNVTKAMSGMYLCHADNGIPPPDTKNIQVIIQCEYLDGRGVMRVDNVTKAVSGMYLCHADNGIPPPDTKNIQVIIQCEYLDGCGVMRVDNVTKAVSGMYLCHADNGIPPPDTKNIQVIIQYPPEVDHSMPNKVAKSTGQTALLRCRAEGAPLVQFNWFKGSSEVNLTSDHYTLDIRQDLTYANRYESRLIISQIDEIDDYGTYVCKAYNDLGEARFEIQLEKTSPPEAPSNLQVLLIAYDSVTLNWTKGFDGGLDQTFQVRFNQKGGKQYQYVDVAPPLATTFTVTNLNPNSEYEFTVRGRNAQGDGPYYLGIVSAKTSIKPTEPPVILPKRSLVGNIPLYMVLLFSFLCILSCVFINIFLCCCLVKRRTKRKKVTAKASAIKKKIEDEIELVKPIERADSAVYTESNTDNMSHHSDDRYSYGEASYDRRRYEDYSDQRSENYDHYDDHQPPPRVITSRMGPGYYNTAYRPPSYAASWDSYEQPPSTGLSESQIDDNEEREYADMLRRQQKQQYMSYHHHPTAPSPVPSSLGNYVSLPKGGSAAPSQVGSEEGYLV